MATATSAAITVCGSVSTLALKLAFARNVTLNGAVPALSGGPARFAVPLPLSGTMPSEVVPEKNSTEPTTGPTPGGFAVTVASSDQAWPKRDGSGAVSSVD